MFGSFFHTMLIGHTLGLYLLIMAIILLSQKSYYQKLLQEIPRQNGSIFSFASFSLLLGIFLVVIHNIWVRGPCVGITMFSWFVLIYSILWLSAPQSMLIFTKKIASGTGYYVIVLGMILLGFFMLNSGFFYHAHL